MLMAAIEKQDKVNMVPALERIMRSRRIKNWRALAKELGITESYLSEIRRGKKIGERKILDFAERLGVSVSYLTGERILIPMLSLVSAGSSFNLNSKEPVELVDISSLCGIDQTQAENYYALRIKDDSFLPHAKRGDTIIVKRESSTLIESGDQVIHKKDGAVECSVKFVEFSGDHVILKPVVGGVGEVVSKSELSQMDKIMYVVKFPLM